MVRMIERSKQMRMKIDPRYYKHYTNASKLRLLLNAAAQCIHQLSAAYQVIVHESKNECNSFIVILQSCCIIVFSCRSQTQ